MDGKIGEFTKQYEEDPVPPPAFYIQVMNMVGRHVIKDYDPSKLTKQDIDNICYEACTILAVCTSGFMSSFLTLMHERGIISKEEMDTAFAVISGNAAQKVLSGMLAGYMLDPKYITYMETKP